MKDKKKTKDQLVTELAELRREIAKLETSGRRRKLADKLAKAQHDLALALNAAVRLDEALRLCVEAAIRISGLDCGGIYLVDQKTGDLDLAFHKGLPAKFVECASHYDADSPSARLVMAGQPVYSQHDKLGVHPDKTRSSEGLRAIAIIPVQHETKVIACLNIASHTLDEVPAFARHALETIAAQIGGVIARMKAEEALWENQERLRAIFDGTVDAIFTKDLQGKYVTINKACRELFGLPEEKIIGKTDFDLFPPQNIRHIRKTDKKVLRGEIVTEEDTKPLGGKTYTFHITKAPLFDDQGNIRGLCGIARDITEHKRAEKELLESRRKIKRLHGTAGKLEACHSEHEVYQLTVEAAEKILALTMCSLDIVEGKKLVVKATTSELPAGASTETDLDETSLAAKTYHTGKTIVFGKLAEVPEARPTREDFRSGISAPIGDIGVFQVVSTNPKAFSDEDVELLELLLGHAAEAVRRIRLRNELREQATRDPLTGVYNRRYFSETIERELKRSKRYQHPIGFLMIDVDRFKEINDTHGHQTGDRVLQEVANFLRESVRITEMVVRFGGDEFLIVMPEMEKDIDAVKRRLIEALARWNETSELFDFPVTFSSGGARWNPDGSESVEHVLARADRLMYADKKRQIAVKHSG